MRIDLYKESIFSVISACLQYLCAASSPIATPVHSQLGPTQVVLANWFDAGSQRVVPFAAAKGFPVSMTRTGAGGTTSPVASPARGVEAPESGTTSATPSAAVGTSVVAAGQYQGNTQKGTQCSRKAKAGSKYGYQHGGEE